MSDPTDTLYFSAVLALQQRDEAEERAERWEALARQLGEALERTYTHRSGCWEDARAALSVYRDAIGESE